MRNFIDLVEASLYEASVQSNRTLYHGTSIEALKNIRVTGLEPQVGALTRNAYDICDEVIADDNGDYYGIPIDEVPDLVFAADRSGIGRCYSAMLSAIEAAHPDIVPLHSAETIRDYGALLILKNKGDDFNHRDRDDQGEGDHPYQVEPGDYYTDRYMEIDAVIMGKKLVQFLIKNRIAFAGKSDMSMRVVVGRAVSLMMKMGRSKDEALARARTEGPTWCYNLVQRYDD